MLEQLALRGSIPSLKEVVNCLYCIRNGFQVHLKVVEGGRKEAEERFEGLAEKHVV